MSTSTRTCRCSRSAVKGADRGSAAVDEHKPVQPEEADDLACPRSVRSAEGDGSEAREVRRSRRLARDALGHGRRRAEIAEEPLELDLGLVAQTLVDDEMDVQVSGLLHSDRVLQAPAEHVALERIEIG